MITYEQYINAKKIIKHYEYQISFIHLRPNEIVICTKSTTKYLTVGKEYKVNSILQVCQDDVSFSITNDVGKKYIFNENKVQLDKFRIKYTKTYDLQLMSLDLSARLLHSLYQYFWSKDINIENVYLKDIYDFDFRAFSKTRNVGKTLIAELIDVFKSYKIPYTY